MPFDFQAARKSAITWFNSKKNTALFFLVILIVGTVAGFARMQLADAAPAEEMAPMGCTQVQPKWEVHRMVEFFLLTCPYCERLEPHLGSVPGGVVRRHLVASRSQEEMARFVFALEKMNRPGLIHAAELAVLDSKGVFIYGSEDSSAFLTAHGLDEDEMKRAHNSDAADKFITETRLMQEACLIRSVPTLMRAGKLTNPSAAGGYEAAVRRVMPPAIVSKVDAMIGVRRE